MVETESQDKLTQINTALNRSMVLMEDNYSNSPKPREKSRKSITINPVTVLATSSPLQEQQKVRKSILKKPEKSQDTSPNTSFAFINSIYNENNEENSQIKEMPRNLDDFIEAENLLSDPTKKTWSLNDVNENDEVWLVEIPKSINPHELRGKTLNLGDKTKLKIGEEKYQATTHQTSDCLTCVFGTGNEKKPYKTVNIRPSGTIVLRRRLAASITKANSHDEMMDKFTVPFPKGLKPRDPLAGVLDSAKIKKKSKSRLKKLESL